MNYHTTLGLGAAALLSLASSPIVAQEAPPTYEADPSVYKLIYEDEHFRVIDGLRKKGVHDKLHSHPVPSIVYYLTDCTDQLYDADGKSAGTPIAGKAGTVRPVPIVRAHSAENVGPADCEEIFVERK
jgi:hypothetical protein